MEVTKKMSFLLPFFSLSFPFLFLSPLLTSSSLLCRVEKGSLNAVEKLEVGPELGLGVQALRVGHIP